MACVGGGTNPAQPALPPAGWEQALKFSNGAGRWLFCRIRGVKSGVALIDVPSGRESDRAKTITLAQVGMILSELWKRLLL